MMSHLNQMGRRIADLKSTLDAIQAIVEDIRAAQPPPPVS